MPPGSFQYTLVGFSPELDWRPLRFVNPIPGHKVCCACGLVPRRTALLPCTHTLCESCYELCAEHGARACPVDGRQYQDCDVDQRDIDVEELLGREVKCWNEENNCRTVLPASQITRHIQRECQHHSACCPRCSTPVLCSGMCAHLRSGCRTTTAAASFEFEVNSRHREETAFLTSLQQSLERPVGEMNARLQLLLVSSDSNSDRLNEIVHGVNNCQEALRREIGQNINSLQETLRQEVAEGRREQRDWMRRCLEEIARFKEETNELLFSSSDTLQAIPSSIHALEKVLKDESVKMRRKCRDKGSQNARGFEGTTGEVKCGNHAVASMNQFGPNTAELQSSVYEFFVEGVESLKAKALVQWCALYEMEKKNMLGYCMTPGIVLHYCFGTVCLYVHFRLHKGGMDDAVKWPLEQTVELCVLHPHGGVSRVIAERTNSRHSCSQRPQDGHVQEKFRSSRYLILEDLIRDGYVEGDRLWVTFRLLP